MREVLQGVLDAQPHFTAHYTDEMRRRGELVRHHMTAWLRARLPDLRAVSVDDLDIDASDGIGRRAEIPWARVHSTSRSPRPRDGWYVVYLFDARGDSVYLALMQGTTTWNGNTPVDRPFPELRARSHRARTALADHLAARPDLRHAITLKGTQGKRARGYEHGTVAAVEYHSHAIPAEDVLDADLRFLVSVLGRLHAIDDDADPAPEVVEAVTAAAHAAGRRNAGQGFRPDHAERVAIERHAVARATRHLEDQGYTVRDVGAFQSYDLHATRPGEQLYVEVKGTTSAGVEVVLTPNEVRLNAEHHPHTMLIVVSDIALDRNTAPPQASGGRMRVVHPWAVADADLTPLSYRYRIGTG
ncbi:MrcB family domain-containing protein [Actinosynnema sp. NPDC004786]